MSQVVAAISQGVERRLRPLRLSLGLVILALCFGAAPIAFAFFQVPDQPSPESGTAQVVAQGVVDIQSVDLRWQVTQRTAPPPANASSSTSGVGFLIVDSGVLLVEDLATGQQQRLPAGEAMLTVRGSEQIRAALGSDQAVYRELTLVDAAEPVASDANVVFTSEPFAGPGARHDIDLLQNELGAGGTMEIPAGALPDLVLVTGGLADITTENGDVLSLGAGEAIAPAGALVLTTADSGASVSVVYTGPAVPSLASQQGTPQPTRRVIGSPVARTAVVTTETLPAPTATADRPTEVDEDGDGLSSQAEIDAGTDPTLSDTDEDGLTDGQEVLEFKTSPLIPDTDDDGVLDGDEVAQGTNPLDGVPSESLAESPVVEEPVVTEEPAAVEPVATAGDSDGDGLEDSIEAELGTDPFDVDTDDDGLTDGDEYYVHATGTRNPDSDGDGVSDGAEISAGTNPNDPGSF